jgi:hypothetical protein
MRKFLLSLILGFALAMPMSVPAVSPQNPQGFAGKAYNATMALYGTIGGETEFICTIWTYKQIPGGYDLISAGHCVGDVHADSYSVADTIDGKLTPVTLIKWVDDSETLDFSLWELKTTKTYPVLDLGTISDQHIGDRIVNPNFSQGITEFLSYGRISGPVVSGGAVPVYPVEVDGAPGASGSPIISLKTRKVIGILIYSPPSLGNLPIPAQLGVGVEPIDNFKTFLQAGPLVPKVKFRLPLKDRERERRPFIPGLSL